jgi:RNA polymerase sigma-70 factor (ECF subfamily)
MEANPDRAALETGSDRDDLLAARDGDHDAGRRLVSRHGPAMVRTARRVLGRYASGDGEDVVQEAFVAALTTTALPQGDVGAWLRAVTARKALDTLRGAARRGEQPLAFDGAGAAGAEPFVESGARLDVLALRQCLARLSPTDRAVLTLVDLEGQSMAEAAGALGLTRVAIRLRAVRARRKLARLLRAGRMETRRGRVTRGQETG